MSTNDPIQSKKAIQELNLLLAEGVELKEKFLKAYLVSFFRFIFVLTHITTSKNELYNWRNKVELILNKYFPDSYYFTHFKYPSIEIKHLPDVPSEFVRNYYSKFDAYTEALKYILRKLNENTEIVREAHNQHIYKDLLKLDVTNATLQYRDNTAINISLTTQIIKLLQLFLSHRGRVIEYKDIAKELQLNAYHDGIDNKSIARDVNYLRRDLVDLLKKTGMAENEIDDFIATQKNFGYKIT